MRITKAKIPALSARARCGRVVVFDTETTGCSWWDEICQIAAAEYVDGERTRTMALYIRPSCRMNPFAQAVHGLSMDFLRANGHEPAEAMRRFFEFVGEDVLLVAHNAAFDLRMLRQECGKYRLSFSPSGVETCDTLKLSRLLRPDLASHALGFLIGALGIDASNSHDALDDTLACAGVFFKLLEQP